MKALLTRALKASIVIVAMFALNLSQLYLTDDLVTIRSSRPRLWLWWGSVSAEEAPAMRKIEAQAIGLYLTAGTAFGALLIKCIFEEGGDPSGAQESPEGRT